MNKIIIYIKFYTLFQSILHLVVWICFFLIWFEIDCQLRKVWPGNNQPSFLTWLSFSSSLPLSWDVAPLLPHFLRPDSHTTVVHSRHLWTTCDKKGDGRTAQLTWTLGTRDPGPSLHRGCITGHFFSSDSVCHRFSCDPSAFLRLYLISCL